jgi:hypothetical protein
VPHLTIAATEEDSASETSDSVHAPRAMIRRLVWWVYVRGGYVCVGVLVGCVGVLVCVWVCWCVCVSTWVFVCVFVFVSHLQ